MCDRSDSGYDSINMVTLRSNSDHKTRHSLKDTSKLNLVFHSINSDDVERVPSHFNHEMFMSTNDPSHQISPVPSVSPACKIKTKSGRGIKTKTKHDTVLKSGFSFGGRVTTYKPPSPSYQDEGDNSDKTIEEIYGTEMKDLSTIQKSTSPVSNHRVLSQRIGKVGYIGQNIFGSLTENAELRPQPVKIQVTDYFIDEDSPVQIDIKWNLPDNAEKFKSLAYNIEMKPKASHEKWTHVSSVKFPVFRVYHTDDKLLLGKVHLPRQSYNLIYVLRCQTQGEIFQDGVNLILVGDWSQNINITFRGYEIEHTIGESLSL